MQQRPLDVMLAPAELLAHWPDDEPLAALWPQGGPHSRWSCFFRHGETLFAHAALDRLDRPLASHVPSNGSDAPPLASGWLFCAMYDLGRHLEPRAQAPRPAADDRTLPEVIAVRCESGLAYDALAHRWWSISGHEPPVARATPPKRASEAFTLANLGSTWGRDGFIAAVERVLEYIRAGDVYQVNLAHRLTGRFDGSPRALWRALCAAAEPWYGLYLEADLPDHRRFALAGASPELFLHFDPSTRRLTTRPMKGTRRVGPGAPEDLASSPKDQAELAMIIDLMRNDLGRVCELASVRVDVPRAIERHANTLLQATGTVSGVLRDGVTLRELLLASFPPGSVTGAPKIRAMQIIDELEPLRRGPYCGCAGFLADTGALTLCVNIRSASIIGRRDGAGLAGTLDYAVGAGLVADSDPRREWLETLDKAATLRAALSRRPLAATPERRHEPREDDPHAVPARVP